MIASREGGSQAERLPGNDAQRKVASKETGERELSPQSVRARPIQREEAFCFFGTRIKVVPRKRSCVLWDVSACFFIPEHGMVSDSCAALS